MTEHDKSTTHQAGAFDIRTFIAMLVGIYGVVLVATGLVGTSDEALARADGLNINLWAGLGMVAVAAAFQVWAKVRPVRVPDQAEQEDDGEEREEAEQRSGHTGTK